MPRPAENCLVCGDKSSGWNFGVRSCECCKAFFRRNALRYNIDSLECKQGNSACKINIKTRKKCKKCRLLKSYSVGMKKEWILTEEDKLQYRNKRLRMRLQMEINSSTLSSSSTTTPESNSPLSSFFPQSSASTKISMSLSSHSSSSSSSTTTNSFLTFCLENDHFQDINLSSPHNRIPAQISPFPIENLVIAEQHLLSELLIACEVIVNPYRQVRHYLTDYMPIGSRPVSPHIFSRMLKMVGSLRAFTSLPPGDQQALIRANSIDLFSLRTVLLYDAHRECWCLADDAAKVTVLASLSIMKPFCSGDVYQRQKSLAGRYRKEWKEDRAIFDILTAIVLFSSPPRSSLSTKVNEKPSLSDQQNVVANEQRRYCRLLSRYLIVKYLGNQRVAEQAYYHLLGNIDEMRELTVGIWRMMINYRDSFRCYPALFSLLTVQQQQQ